MKENVFKFFVAALAAAYVSCAAIAGSYVNVASGTVERVLNTRKGRILGQSYKTRGVEFMRKGSPEFAFRVVDKRAHRRQKDFRGGAVLRLKCRACVSKSLEVLDSPVDIERCNCRFCRIARAYAFADTLHARAAFDSLDYRKHGVRAAFAAEAKICFLAGSLNFF